MTLRIAANPTAARPVDETQRLKDIGRIIAEDQFRRAVSPGELYNERQLQGAAAVWSEDLSDIPSELLLDLGKRARRKLGPKEKLHPDHIIAEHALSLRQQSRGHLQMVPAKAKPEAKPVEYSEEEKRTLIRRNREVQATLEAWPCCNCDPEYPGQNACDKNEDGTAYVCAFNRCDFHLVINRLDGKPQPAAAPLADALDKVLARAGKSAGTTAGKGGRRRRTANA